MLALPKTVIGCYGQISFFLFVSFFLIAVLSCFLFNAFDFAQCMVIVSLVCIMISLSLLSIEYYRKKRNKNIQEVGDKIPATITKLGSYSLINYSCGSPRHPYFLLCTFQYHDIKYQKRSELLWEVPNINELEAYAFIHPLTLKSFVVVQKKEFNHEVF